MKKLFLMLLLVVGLAAPAAAGPVAVVNTGVSPGVTVNVNLPWLSYIGEMSAGVMNLTVDGMPYDAFCIDLYHFASSSSLLYTIDPLADSPKAGSMGPDKAAFIQEMWAYGYANALTGDSQAAAFQLAIWGVAQGSISNGVSTPDWTWLTGGDLAGALALINWANQNAGPLANVVGLNQYFAAGTNGTSAQSYAIELPVPDGGATIVLLGGALIGVGALGRRLRRR